MPRCKKFRCCRSFPGDIVYKLRGIPLSDLAITVINLDEFEAMRLCDCESHDQEAAGIRMGISRGTIQRLLDKGRKKMLSAFLSGAAIRIVAKNNTKSKIKKE